MMTTRVYPRQTSRNRSESKRVHGGKTRCQNQNKSRKERKQIEKQEKKKKKKEEESDLVSICHGIDNAYKLQEGSFSRILHVGVKGRAQYNTHICIQNKTKDLGSKLRRRCVYRMDPSVRPLTFKLHSFSTGACLRQEHFGILVYGLDS